MNKVKFFVILFFLITLSTFSQEKKHIVYQVQKGETIYSISRKFSITPHDLLQLNPDIKDDIKEDQLIIVPNKNYKPELDKEIGDYVKDGFLYHKVLPKENYFRLKQKYGTPKRVLRKHNLVLRTDDLKVGQIIKIPVKKGFSLNVVKDLETKPYLVRPKETKYSIAKRYGISVEKLEELNPHIKEGLRLADIIKVPNTREIPNLDEDIILHQVEKGETIFSLSQKFKISQEYLIEVNPELKEGLKDGMIIRIPTEPFEENKSKFVANIPIDEELKIAMMLPFSRNKNSFDFKKDRTLNIVTDFYLGALIALDSVKQQGLSVSMKVFDTQNSRFTISNIIKTNNFNDIDALIGPMYVNNVEFVANALQNDSLAIISPVSSKDHAKNIYQNIIRETPSNKQLSNKVLGFIEENYEGQQLIIINEGEKENELITNEIVERLSKLDSIHNPIVLKPEEGYIKPDLFRETILENKKNWIILLTNDDVVTADVVNNLGVLPEEFDITLFCLSHGKNFDKIDNNFLARVNFHYPTESFIDYENDRVQRFIQKYKSKNHIEPSEYAFKGFDITYDTLLRLATYYSNIDDAFLGGVSERASSRFFYSKNADIGFENKGVFLIKYDGLHLKKVQ